jgi:hypothetical protein
MRTHRLRYDHKLKNDDVHAIDGNMSLEMPPDKLTDATKWSSVNQWARNEPNVNDDGAIDLEAPSHKGKRMNQRVMS